MPAENEDPCPAELNEDAREESMRAAFLAGASVDDLVRIYHWSRVQIEAVIRRGQFPLLQKET